MYLHHTNWDLRAIALPFHTSTAAFGEHSRYWKSRVVDRAMPPANLEQARKFVELVQDTPASMYSMFLPQFPALFPGVAALVGELQASTAIDVEAWARRIAAERLAVEVQKELMFEHVRAAEFSSAPSRSRCLFLIDGDGDAEAHMAAQGFNDPWRNIVEVEALEGAELLRVDSSLLNCNALPAAQQEDRARAYWAGTTAKSPAIEVLLSGPFRITRAIRLAPAYATDSTPQSS